MAYQICKRCGSMFDKNGKQYCKTCFEKNEKEYDLITEYVRKHQNATVLDIITATGVSLKSINCLVEDGGISYVENKVSIRDREESSNVDTRIVPRRNKFHLTR